MSRPLSLVALDALSAFAPRPCQAPIMRQLDPSLSGVRDRKEIEIVRDRARMEDPTPRTMHVSGFVSGHLGEMRLGARGLTRAPRPPATRWVHNLGVLHVKCPLIAGAMRTRYRAPSGVLLPCVQNGEHLDHVGHTVDENIIGMDDRFSRAGHSAGAMDIGMFGQQFGGVNDGPLQALGG